MSNPTYNVTTLSLVTHKGLAECLTVVHQDGSDAIDVNGNMAASRLRELGNLFIELANKAEPVQ